MIVTLALVVLKERALAIMTRRHANNQADLLA
jgi:hypothetical protein